MARGMPRIDPRTMRKLQRQLKTEQLEVIEVRMKLPQHTLLFRNPVVTMTEVSGQRTYQVIGTPEEVVDKGDEKESAATIIPQEDIALVAQRAGVSEMEAREALVKTDGDIAEAIILLMGD